MNPATSTKRRCGIATIRRPAHLDGQRDQTLDERLKILGLRLSRRNPPVLDKTLGEVTPKRPTVLRCPVEFSMTYTVLPKALPKSDSLSVLTYFYFLHAQYIPDEMPR